MNNVVNTQLWRGWIGLMALALASALALIIALALGWNSPRPTASPDWQAPDLPFTLQVLPDESAVALLNHLSSDFTLQVTASASSTPASNFNGYGLVYRAQDGDNCYIFAIGSDGYYAILRMTEGAETLLVDWQQFPHIRRGGQTNQLRVACASSTCRFYVNDEYAATVEDSAWLVGDVGLWGSSFGGKGMTVRFADARAWAR